MQSHVIMGKVLTIAYIRQTALVFTVHITIPLHEEHNATERYAMFAFVEDCIFTQPYGTYRFNLNGVYIKSAKTRKLVSQSNAFPI